MRFLKNLFGNAATEHNLEMEPVIVNEHLFRTDEEPFEQPVHHHKESQPVLKEILNRNFESLGFQDGYHHHAPEHLKNRLTSIQAEFRMIYQSEIQELDRDILKCKNLLSEELKQTMPQQYQRIQNRLDALKLQKVALDAELDLAKNGEGFCEKAVADYRLGFERGFSLFSDEQLFNDRYLMP